MENPIGLLWNVFPSMKKSFSAPLAISKTGHAPTEDPDVGRSRMISKTDC
jgi:hypothetical protein